VRGPKGRFVYKKNECDEIGMLAGGTGITPMLQVIREVLKHDDDRTKLSLIFGNVTVDDIIFREELDALAAQHPGRFRVHHVLNNPPQGWTGGVGFVSEQACRDHLPAPNSGKKVKMLICGPPPMVRAMEGHLTKIGVDLNEQLHTF
jgi:cytochrome-b5 reductase